MFVDSHKENYMPSDALFLGQESSNTGFAPHAILGTAIESPYPPHFEKALFGMGCFWGVEKLFWQQKGVYTTAVGYCAGQMPDPTYDEVCAGVTGHNEVVLVVYDPMQTWYRDLLSLFWENHNPTEGHRQGNDTGDQYRSGIYPVTPEQHFLARQSVEAYQKKLTEQSLPRVTTEIVNNPCFYFAEEYHQQYLAKNMSGYCNTQNLQKTGFPRFGG